MLIVEDGTIIPYANSYASVDEIIAYAGARGINFSGSPIEEAVTIIGIKSMDYIEAFKDKWKGNIIEQFQPLSWPRKNVVLNGYNFPTDEIPRDLVNAQCQVCIEIQNGIDLFPATDNSASFVTREKVGPIETSYSEAVRLAAGSLPSMPAVDALLRDLIVPSKFGLQTIRV